MERAERVVVLCAGLVFNFLLVPLLWVMLVLTLATAVQRFAKVWRQATAAGLGMGPKAEVDHGREQGGDPAAGAGIAAERAASAAPVAAPPVAAPELAVTARWRAWREANGWAPRPPRYAPAPRTTAAERWRERRRTRLEAEGRPARRRSGTRRP